MYIHVHECMDKTTQSDDNVIQMYRIEPRQISRPQGGLFMQFKNWSLRYKILVPTFVTVLAILVVTTWVMTSKSQDILVEQAKSTARKEARGYGEKIKVTLDL